jgi:hypothetical protein
VTGYFDPDAARARYSTEESEALMRIAFIDPASYVAEAVDLARTELARHGIDRPDDSRVLAERLSAVRERHESTMTRDQELSRGWRKFCVAFPEFCIIVAVALRIGSAARGRRRVGVARPRPGRTRHRDSARTRGPVMRVHRLARPESRAAPRAIVLSRHTDRFA